MSIKDEVLHQGYALIHGYFPKIDILAIANQLGKTLEPWDGGMVQDLVPRSNSTPNTYSGIYRLGAFPFHTDLAHWRSPPRFLVLRCVTGYSSVPTLLIDGKAIVESLSFEVLGRAIVKPRRPRQGSLPLLRLCASIADECCLRWDDVFLQSASNVGAVAMSRMRDYISNCKPVKIRLVELGDTVLIDNWRMLHARSSIPAGCEKRKIQRVYLESLY